MASKQLFIQKTAMGGGSPVPVQTMWKEPRLYPLDTMVEKLSNLRDLGCDILRFAVPDEETAKLLCQLSSMSPVPIVGDIHFDYKLALLCLDALPKIRLNPGNIGADWKVREIVTKAKDTGAVIRIGVNGGSLPRDLADLPVPEAMVTAAEREIELFLRKGFDDIVISLKSSDMEETIAANRLFAGKHSYPLHLGVTEAGPLVPGIVKNSIALGILLKEGIGDTIRVSLTDSPENELYAGGEILRAVGMQRAGVKIISCPKCGRSTFDTHRFLADIEQDILRIRGDVTIAVMGCVVNGPGEAKHADLGISGVGNKIMIFQKGSIVKETTQGNAREEFLSLLEELS